jgi:arginine/lysine/ornithine decarboxylase
MNSFGSVCHSLVHSLIEMADCYDDEPTPAERIAAIDREMERYREAQRLQKLGDKMPAKYNDPERLITLSLQKKAIEKEEEKKETDWYDAHDIG